MSCYLEESQNYSLETPPDIKVSGTFTDYSTLLNKRLTIFAKITSGL